MRAERRTLLVVAALVLTTACDAIMGPTAPDTNWQRQTVGQFTFYVRPGSFAQTHVSTFADVLADHADYVRSRLGHSYTGHITLYMHNSGDDAQFDGDGGGGDHSGVAYPETETVKVAVVPPLDGNLYSLLSHEVTHVILRNAYGRPGTTFVNEGSASALVSERRGAIGASVHHTWVRNRIAQIPRLADLTDDERWRSFDQPTSYTVSASFLSYLLDRFGPGPYKSIYYASSRDFAAKFRTAYGQSLEEVEAEWKAFVAGTGPGAA
jgi:hypothetical protein